MNDQTVDLMQPWAFLKQTVGFLGSLRPFVSNNSETLRDWNWSNWSPVSCWTEVGFPWDMKGAKKNRDTILTTWFVIKWWWKKLDVSSPFFWIWSKVNWMPTDCAVNSSGSYLTLIWDRYENSPTGQPVNRVNGQVGYHPGLSELVSGSSANKLFGESFWMLISVPIGLMYLGPNLENFLKRPFQLETVVNFMMFVTRLVAGKWPVALFW